MRSPYLIRIAFFPALAFWVAGCASTRMGDTEPDRLFRQGRYDEAAALLDKSRLEHGESGRDALLYILDEALALHAAGKFEESNKLFLRAEKIAEIKDYTSIAAETGSLLTSENAKDYSAEEFENVLINVYLAMNYALLGERDEALVECRKVNRKLERMVDEGGRKYQQNAFARYLSGVLYEMSGDWDDAYLEYKRTKDLMPGFPLLGRDLWRAAWKGKRTEVLADLAAEYSLSKEDLKEIREDTKRGEVIVLFENGLSPIKRPNPDYTALPRFYARHNPVSAALVSVDGVEAGSTQLLHDIESIAMQNLDEKYGGMIAKRLAGLIVKGVAAKQIENATDSPLVGFLARIAFLVSDQADLRSWYLLPRDLQILRVPVEPGVRTVRLRTSQGELPEKTVQVPKGGKAFVNLRYMP